MSNIICFKKIPEIKYCIVTGSDYVNNSYRIRLTRKSNGKDIISVSMVCKDFEVIDEIRNQVLQEVNKGYAAICNGRNAGNWVINYDME